MNSNVQEVTAGVAIVAAKAAFENDIAMIDDLCTIGRFDLYASARLFCVSALENYRSLYATTSAARYLFRSASDQMKRKLEFVNREIPSFAFDPEEALGFGMEFLYAVVEEALGNGSVPQMFVGDDDSTRRAFSIAVAAVCQFIVMMEIRDFSHRGQRLMPDDILDMHRSLMMSNFDSASH